MAALQWLLRLAAVVLVAATQQAASALPLTAVPLLPARRLQPLPGHAICDFHNNTQLVDPGGKYTRGPSTAHSPQECCDICGRDDECQGAVLYGEGCFTKTKVFPGVPQTPPPGVALVACVYKSWSPSPSPSPPSPPSPPPHGTAVIGSKAAADPPKPQLPGAYSVVWDLTEGTAGSMVVVATGTTDVDDAGQGKQRDVQTMKRKSDLHPGLNFYSVIDSISDYVTGDRWTHTCSNQTIAEVCSCQHSALSGSIPYIDPAGWSYAGLQPAAEHSGAEHGHQRH